MKRTILKSLATVIALFSASMGYADDAPVTAEEVLPGTWFVEVTGVLPDGGAYQNIMNISSDGTADIVGGWMFGAAGVKFTDSPASVTHLEGDSFEIQMFAFLADAVTGAPKGINITVYRGHMEGTNDNFNAEADLYYLPCDVSSCPAPDMSSLGEPATVAQITATRLAAPATSKD